MGKSVIETNNFETAIRSIRKDIYPQYQISSSAVTMVNSMIQALLHRVVVLSDYLVSIRKEKTIKEKTVEAAFFTLERNTTDIVVPKEGQTALQRSRVENLMRHYTSKRISRCSTEYLTGLLQVLTVQLLEDACSNIKSDKKTITDSHISTAVRESVQYRTLFPGMYQEEEPPVESPAFATDVPSSSVPRETTKRLIVSTIRTSSSERTVQVESAAIDAVSELVVSIVSHISHIAFQSLVHAQRKTVKEDDVRYATYVLGLNDFTLGRGNKLVYANARFYLLISLALKQYSETKPNISDRSLVMIQTLTEALTRKILLRAKYVMEASGRCTLKASDLHGTY